MRHPPIGAPPRAESREDATDSAGGLTGPTASTSAAWAPADALLVRRTPRREPAGVSRGHSAIAGARRDAIVAVALLSLLGGSGCGRFRRGQGER